MPHDSRPRFMQPSGNTVNVANSPGNLLMRALRLLGLVVFCGCATQDIAQQTGKARFDTYPARLFSAFESTCQAPADTFLQKSKNHVQCRSYLPPETTAAAILRYDGITEDLPQLVFNANAIRDSQGYLVEIEGFLNVPQRSGPPRKVVYVSPGISKSMKKVLISAGGKIEPAD